MTTISRDIKGQLPSIDTVESENETYLKTMLFLLSCISPTDDVSPTDKHKMYILIKGILEKVALFPLNKTQQILYDVRVFDRHGNIVDGLNGILAWNRREAYFEVMNSLLPHETWDASIQSPQGRTQEDNR